MSSCIAFAANEKLEAHKPLPPLVDVIGARAEIFMRVFERVCVNCPNRLKYPHCPAKTAKSYFKRTKPNQTLNADDQRERAMMEGIETWREKRID